MLNYKEQCISENTKMSQAIECLNIASLKILFVINNENKLIGTITDGDVRRSLLKEFSMDTKASLIMNSFPKSSNYKDTIDERQKILKDNEISTLPILDDYGVLCGVESISPYKKVVNTNIPVIIMAGGFGSRLGELTKHNPKPMLKINNKPILEYLIKNLADQGFVNLYVTTYYKSDKITEYFKSGRKWDVEIKYIKEDFPLGTAGSLSLIDNLESDQPILVTNADLLTSISYRNLLDFHNEEKNMCTICVSNFENQIPYGVINYKGSKLDFIVEKPIYNFPILAGIYVIQYSLIKKIPKNKRLDMPEFINMINKKKNIGIFPIHEYWKDIGRKGDLMQAQLKSSLKKD